MELRLAKFVIGSGPQRLRAASLEAYRAGDTDKAVDLLAEAKLAERRQAAMQRLLRN